MSEDMDWLLSPFWYQKLDVQPMGIMFEIAPMCRAANKGCCNLFSCFSSPNVTFLRKRAHSQILERYPRGNFALKGSWELNFCFKTETKVCCLSKLLCQSIQDTACLSHSLFEFVMDSNMYFDEKPNVLFESHKFIRQKHNIICWWSEVLCFEHKVK